MRIIAGSFKGCRLAGPTWEGLRPTSDKLRETLFNILAPRIGGARVLDGYAGTGALGIEALSRGAAHVTFVDRDRRAQALIAENLRRCGIENGYVIIRASVAQALASLDGKALFDIILLDPPYEAGRLQDASSNEVGRLLAAVGTIVTTDGVLVLEHLRKRPQPSAAGCLVRTREVTSGDSALALYELCRRSPSTPVPSIP